MYDLQGTLLKFQENCDKEKIDMKGLIGTILGRLGGDPQGKAQSNDLCGMGSEEEERNRVFQEKVEEENIKTSTETKLFKVLHHVNEEVPGDQAIEME